MHTICLGFEDMMAGIDVCPKPLKVDNEDINHKETETLQYDCSLLCCTLYGIDVPYGSFLKLLEAWYGSRSRGINDVCYSLRPSWFSKLDNG